MNLGICILKTLVYFFHGRTSSHSTQCWPHSGRAFLRLLTFLLPLPKICHTYPTVKKLWRVFPHLKKTAKLYELILVKLLPWQLQFSWRIENRLMLLNHCRLTALPECLGIYSEEKCCPKTVSMLLSDGASMTFFNTFLFFFLKRLY